VKSARTDAGGSVFGKLQRAGSGGNVKKDNDKSTEGGRGSMGFRARAPMSTGNSKEKSAGSSSDVDTTKDVNRMT